MSLALACGAVMAGACVQGSVGLGFGLLAAPLLVMVDPQFVPGPMLVLAMLLTVAIAHRERRRIDLRGMRWALVGRLPGTVLGAAAVALLPRRALAVTLAVVVLAGVAMSLGRVRLAPSPRVLFLAGAVSGVMGTAASIGGPPVALVYQRAPGPVLRATLAGYFVVGSMISLVGLAAFGQLGLAELRTGLSLAPAMAVGYLASRRLTGVLDRGHTRTAVLAVSAASSLLLLARELW